MPNMIGVLFSNAYFFYGRGKSLALFHRLRDEATETQTDLPNQIRLKLKKMRKKVEIFHKNYTPKVGAHTATKTKTGRSKARAQLNKKITMNGNVCVRATKVTKKLKEHTNLNYIQKLVKRAKKIRKKSANSRRRSNTQQNQSEGRQKKLECTEAAKAEGYEFVKILHF